MAQQPDISKSGFAAISKPTLSPTGPQARKQLVRNPDGSVTLQYVDNNTGAPLDSLQGYTIVEASNYMTLDDLGLNPVKETEDDKESPASQIIKQTQNQSFGGSDSGGDSSASGGRARSGGPVNNFGYIDKPGWMGLAGALPGAGGLIGKGVNLGINVNNTVAMNKARDLMDVPSQGFMGNVKSSLKDQHGQIGDFKIGPTQYAVGFEAVDKYGRTNLTPQEALNRSRALGVPITQASRTEVKSAISEFKSEFPKSQGLISKFATGAESFIDNLFGRPATPEYAPIPTPRPASYQSSGGGGTPSGVSLPDYAPIPTSRPSYSGGSGYTGGGPTGGGSGGGGGVSQQAQDAISRGGGGLY